MKAPVIIWAVGMSFMIGQSAQKSAPTIPDALKLKYYKAEVRHQAAERDLESSPVYKSFQVATDTVKAIQDEITRVCGKDYDPQIVGDMDVVCTAKPKPEAKK